MKKLVILLSFTFISFSGYSQIEAIEAAADGIALMADVVSSDACSDCCSDPFLFYFIDEAIIHLVEDLSDHHIWMMENRDIYPDALSFTYRSHFASNGAETVNLLQSVNGTWGVLSTDLRLNMLAEFNNFSARSYETINWQILVLNTYPAENVNLRLGSGIIYDNYAERSYNEHYGSLGVSFLDKKVTAILEGRYASAYYNLAEVYSEVNLRTEVKLIDRQDFVCSFMIGGIYQNYYATVQYASLQAGLTLALR